MSGQHRASVVFNTLEYSAGATHAPKGGNSYICHRDHINLAIKGASGPPDVTQV
jgi:hypothetical protein